MKVLQRKKVGFGREVELLMRRGADLAARHVQGGTATGRLPQNRGWACSKWSNNTCRVLGPTSPVAATIVLYGQTLSIVPRGSKTKGVTHTYT